MSCSTCVNNLDGKPSGCKSNGGCGTNSCNKLNTYDWMVDIDRPAHDDFDLVEISFKNGARKAFFHNHKQIQAITGDMVVVESGNGYDIGQISLSGELVRLQMKKRKTRQGTLFGNVIRIANQRDLEKLREARLLEKPTMVRARVIARTLGLDMKIGDIEYQGDKRKATFFYTADGRVDFRELIRHFAKEFKVKIEMRQIGARQESARIGGLGSCGRELCCSTWLTDFKSVTTSAARYQNLAINQAKLSGMCGRLKCCLNYELDTYMDALEEFPDDADKLYTQVGTAYMVKTDIFKRTMYYQYARNSEAGKPSKFYALDLERVDVIMAMNAKGEKPEDLIDPEIAKLEAEKLDFDEELTGIIELKEEKRHYKKKKRRKKKVNPFTDGDKQKGGKNRPAKNKRGGQRPNNKSNKERDNRGPKNRSEQKGQQSEQKDGKPNNRNNRKSSNNKNKRDNRPPKQQPNNKAGNPSEQKDNSGDKQEKGDQPNNNKRRNNKRRNNNRNRNRNKGNNKDNGDKKE